MIPFLFVYGSLKRGGELHYHLRRLGAQFLTEARVAAVIVGRRRYPGARSTNREGKWVAGELFRLRQPARDLRVLDEVEGFFAAAPARSGFVRVQTEVVLNHSELRQAWIYWLRTGHRVSDE